MITRSSLSGIRPATNVTLLVWDALISVPKTANSAKTAMQFLMIVSSVEKDMRGMINKSVSKLGRLKRNAGKMSLNIK